MKRYTRDPRWIVTRYPTACKTCGRPIAKGDRAIYYPSQKALCCDGPDCGQQASRDFDAAAADEAFMTGDCR